MTTTSAMPHHPSHRIPFPNPETSVDPHPSVPPMTDSTPYEPQPAPSIYPSLSASSLTISHLRPMPRHWQNEYPDVTPRLRPILYRVFQILCLVATGRPDLARAWRALTIDDEHEYVEATKRMSTMVSASNISSGFLLASIATLITTNPPRDDIFDYTLRGPYICFLVSLATSLLSILCGSAVLVGLSRAIREWQIRVAMATRARIWVTLVFLACPLLFVLLTIGLAGIGQTCRVQVVT
ncbi:hypothetical protein PENSPDRAFT_303575 [Peniophora sp. CONT]|nr:hypothetical protein PENSPDRAFT_303575 [Peniophora sp. CONT]